MTLDEFEKILIAAKEMRTYNIGGEPWISLRGIIDIIQTNLHPEDRVWDWKGDDKTWGWVKRDQQT